MPKFQIEANGKTYEVEAPDMQTAVAATKGVLTPGQRVEGALDAAQSVQQLPAPTAWKGSILPVSRDTQGASHFDMSAGLPGAVGRMLTPPAQPMQPDAGQGVTSPEAISWAAEMAAGASPASAAMKAGERMIPGVSQALRREKPAIPTSEELRAAGAEGYNQARSMGVDYDPKAVAGMASTLGAELERDGINPVVAPKTFRLLQMLQSPPPGAGASLTGLDTARKAFRNAAKDFSNPTEQLAAQRIIEQLDRFTENPDAASVVAGPAATATSEQAYKDQFQTAYDAAIHWGYPPKMAGEYADTFAKDWASIQGAAASLPNAVKAGAVQKDARGNYAAAMRSRSFAGKQDQAELSAAASNSGANTDNALRQRVRDVLKSPKASAGYSDEELAAMRRFVIGDKSRNMLRKVSNLLGGGGGLGSVVTGMAGVGAGGYALGAPGAAAGVALPIIGWGAKAAQNRMARKGMTQLDEAIRKRSPLYGQRLANAPVSPVSPEMRAAMLRASLMYGQQR